MIATALGLKLGLNLRAIGERLKSLKPVHARLQLLPQPNGINLINDAYNSNPVGARYALEILGGFESGKKILVTPGMVELGVIEKEENHNLGLQAAGLCDFVILVGVERTAPIYEGLREAKFDLDKVVVVSTFQKARETFLRLAQQGDTVLLLMTCPISIPKNLNLYHYSTEKTMGQKRKVGVIFGGRSVEHDVSIITGLQIIRALDRERYEVVPIYISKNGEWYTGNALTDIGSFLNFDPDVIGATRAAIPPDRGVGGLITPLTSGWLRSSKVIPLDVVFPCVHGTHGEDGTLQGLLEMADLPYVGCDVVSSAIGMNKVMTKKILRYHGLPILDFLIIGKYEWQLDSNQAIGRISDKFRYPLFVKPVALGSSIGISKAQNETELREALETALSFDDAAMIESAVENMIEVNCAVLGDLQELTASACEQPIPWQDFLNMKINICGQSSF